MQIIGITGSIATGKSTVTNYLLKKGYVVVDSDKLAYDALTIDENSKEQVKRIFDCQDEEGNIDRKKLGSIIFQDKIAKKRLEDIVHPYVIGKIRKAIENNKNKLVIFLDIPLLYEANLEYLCNKIAVVYICEKEQIKRLMKRDGIDEKYARMIIGNQISIDKKRAMADIVIDNSGTLESLYRQIDEKLGVE